MPKQLNRIETHSHYMPSVIYGACGPYGPEMILDREKGTRGYRVGDYRTQPRLVGTDPKALELVHPTEPSARLARMDELNIDVMGVSASPMIYCYLAEVDDAVRYCTVYNDAMASYCAQAPDRLFFIPTLPLQDIKSAIAELGRAYTIGGRGVNIGTDVLGEMDLDDDKLSPFYEYCEANDITIWLHPAPTGADDPSYLAAPQKPDKYLFAWLIGYPYREMVAFATMIYSGVFDRYPKLKVCLPHGGGFAPYQFARLDYGWQQKLTGSIVNKEPIDHYLKRFYFDNVVHDIRARKFLLDIMGPDNVFVGSNFGGWDAVDGFAYADDMTDDPAVLHKLCAGNAIKLFKLEGMGREVTAQAEELVG